MTFADGGAKDRNDDHEQTVAQEFASIGAQLENLRALIAAPGPADQRAAKFGLPLSLSALAKQLIADRRARNAEFPCELFADPAWDILLDLFVAHSDALRISVTSAVIAANVPPTTALRWITLMADRGYLIRVPDPHDRRRVHIELAEDTAVRIKNYLQGLAKKWGIILLQPAPADNELAN